MTITLSSQKEKAWNEEKRRKILVTSDARPPSFWVVVSHPKAAIIDFILVHYSQCRLRRQQQQQQQKQKPRRFPIPFLRDAMSTMDELEEEKKFHIKPQSAVSVFLLSATRPYTVTLLAAGMTLVVRTAASSSFGVQRIAPAGYLLPAHSSLCLNSLNLVWLGFDLSICFMEAWVKFNAPSVKREQVLDIGRHVFAALNTVEIVFSCAGVWLAMLVPGPKREAVIVMSTLAGLVFLEGFYFMPALSKRISDTIKGREVAKSHLHATEALISTLKISLLLSSAVFTHLVL